MACPMRVTLVLLSLVIGAISAFFLFRDDDEEGEEHALLSVGDDGDNDSDSSGEVEEDEDEGRAKKKRPRAKRVATAAECDEREQTWLRRVHAKLTSCRAKLSPRITWKSVLLIGGAHGVGFGVLWKYAAAADAAMTASTQ